MMETIISWISQAVGQALEAIVQVFLNNLQLDLTVFVNTFPVVAASFQIFQAIGAGLVLGIALFQLVKFFAGQLAETKDTPIRILVRSAIAMSLIWMGGNFISIIVDLARTPYDVFVNDVNAVSWGFSFDGLDVGTLFATDLGAAVLSPGTLLLLALILMLLIGFNVLKLLLEVCERFLMVGLLAYSAPLIYPTLASQSTSAIFKKWLGMFFGQCVLMTLSVWTLKVILSGFTFSPGGAGNFIQLALTLAMCKLAQRVDTYMQQLGIGVASTGGNLLDDVVGVAMAMRGISGGGGKGKTADSVLGAGEGSVGGRTGIARFGGAFGAASNAISKGLQSFKNGDDMATVSANVGMAAAAGYSGPLESTLMGMVTARKEAQKKNVAENAKAGVEAFNKRKERYPSPNGTAKGYTSDIQNKAAKVGQTAQQFAQAQFLSDGAGSFVKAAGGKRAALDDVAKRAGLIWKGGQAPNGRPEMIKGESSAVGQHMASNYASASVNPEPEYDRALVETALKGAPLAAEEALMNPNYELEGNDQMGAALLTNAFGEGFDKVYGEEKDASGKYSDMAEFKAALDMRSDNDLYPNGDGISNIRATTDANDGRMVSCDYKAVEGAAYRVDTMDEKAYHNAPEAERKQMREFTTRDGTKYYTRYAEVSIDRNGPEPLSSSPAPVSSSPQTAAPTSNSASTLSSAPVSGSSPASSSAPTHSSPAPTQHTSSSSPLHNSPPTPHSSGSTGSTSVPSHAAPGGKPKSLFGGGKGSRREKRK